MDITKARLHQIILEELQAVETEENKENLTVDILHENCIYIGNNQFIGNKEIDLIEKVIMEL